MKYYVGREDFRGLRCAGNVTAKRTAVKSLAFSPKPKMIEDAASPKEGADSNGLATKSPQSAESTVSSLYVIDLSCEHGKNHTCSGS